MTTKLSVSQVSSDIPALNQRIAMGSRSFCIRDVVQSILEGLARNLDSNCYEICIDENSCEHIDVRVGLKTCSENKLINLAFRVESLIARSLSSLLTIEPIASLSFFDDMPYCLSLENSTLAKCFLRSAEENGPSLHILIDGVRSPLEKLAQVIYNHSGDFNEIILFFQEMQQFLPLAETLEEKTKIACGSLKRFFIAYENALDYLPDSLWDELSCIVSLAICEQSKGKPWKDLFMVLFKKFQGDLNGRALAFLDGLFYRLPKTSNLTEKAQEKLIFNLYSFSLSNTSPKLSRNESLCLQEILESKDLRENVSSVRKCFKNREIKDPFNFKSNLTYLLVNKKIEEALNLVRCQENLVGFLNMQSDCQELFYTKGSEPARKEYLKFLMEVLTEEKDEKIKLQIALNAYVYLYHIPDLANFIEEKFFFSRLNDLLKLILERDKVFKTSCQQAFHSRLKERLIQEKPVFVCVLLEVLFSLSGDRVFVAKYLADLLQRCIENSGKKKKIFSEIELQFSSFWSEILAEVKNTSVEKILIIELSKRNPSIEVQRKCFFRCVEFLTEGEPVEPLISVFLEAVTEKEKFQFIQKCIELHVRKINFRFPENLFETLVNQIPHWKELFQDSSWSLQSLDGCFDFLKKLDLLREDRVESLFLKLPEGDFLNTNSRDVIAKFIPYLTEVLKEECLEKIKNQIDVKIQSKRPLQEVISNMSFMLKSGLIPLPFQSERQRLIGNECFSFFSKNLEMIHKLALKKNQDAMILFVYMENYLSLVAVDEERALIVYNCAICNCGFIHKALSEISDPTTLQTHPWTDEEIKNSFNIVQSGSSLVNSQKFVEFALEYLKNYPLETVQKMIPFLTARSKNRLISQMIKWASPIPEGINKKLFVEDFLSSCVELQSCFF